MKKPAPKHEGLIVAAYPGMGQNIMVEPEFYEGQSHKNKYILHNIDSYTSNEIRDDEWPYIRYEANGWAKRYVEDAIDLVTVGPYDVCFVDVHPGVLNYLEKSGIPFLILYPNFSQMDVLRNLASLHFSSVFSVDSTSLASAVLHFDSDIERLRRYSNAIAVSNPIIDPDLLNRFAKMTPTDRKNVLNAIGSMKQTKFKRGEGNAMKTNQT